MTFHIDAAAAEDDTFGFEAQALFKTRFATEFNCASGAKDALPGKSDGAAQDTDDLPSSTGVSGGTGDSAVSRNFAARDRADGGEDIGVERHRRYFSLGEEIVRGDGFPQRMQRRKTPLD